MLVEKSADSKAQGSRGEGSVSGLRFTVYGKSKGRKRKKRVQVSGFRVQGGKQGVSGFRVQVSGNRTQGLGFSGQGSGTVGWGTPICSAGRVRALLFFEKFKVNCGEGVA